MSVPKGYHCTNSGGCSDPSGVRHCHTGCPACVEEKQIKEVLATIAEKDRKYSKSVEALVMMRLRAEKAEADIRSMVKKAADNELGGYRELGERAAKAELRAEKAEADNVLLREKMDVLMTVANSNPTQEELDLTLNDCEAALDHVVDANKMVPE